MGNRNKKVVQIQKRGKAGMMDQAVKDIMDVSDEVMNQLEMKRGMMQSILDTVEAGFENQGLDVKLRLASDGYDFLFSDMQDYLADDLEEPDIFDMMDDEDDEEEEPIEMFAGEDGDGNEYSILVVLRQNEEDEDSFDMNIAVVRERDGRPEILTDNGWEAPDFSEF